MRLLRAPLTYTMWQMLVTAVGDEGHKAEIVQFRIRHDRWRKALTTHLYRISLYLKIKIFINTGGKVPQIWKLNNTQSCKQVIFSSSLNFRSRLTPYKCVVSAFIQRSWRIRNWTISLLYGRSPLWGVGVSVFRFFFFFWGGGGVCGFSHF